MFRDSRGVVHTVSSADPLEDLPQAASSALARTLLVPAHGDVGSALERCEAVRQLLDRWQDAFFAALPADVDLAEESRWAAEAGLSLEEVESQWEEPEDWDDEDDWSEGDETPGQLGLDQIELSELNPLEGEDRGRYPLKDEAVPLEEEVVAELEVALQLLPLRVRLEALVAATTLVDSWADLFADHEKLLGHLVLQHGALPVPGSHDELADQHAALHAGLPGHA